MKQIRNALPALLGAIASALLSVAAMRRVIAPEVAVEREPAVSEAEPAELHVPVDHISTPQPALRPGWSLAQPAEIPKPTYWPIVMALGITLFAWGVVTSLIISFVGLVLFVLSLVGWLGDIQDEHTKERI